MIVAYTQRPSAITKFMNQYCARFPFVAGEAIPLSTRLTSAHDTASVYRSKSDGVSTGPHSVAKFCAKPPT